MKDIQPLRSNTEFQVETTKFQNTNLIKIKDIQTLKQYNQNMRGRETHLYSSLHELELATICGRDIVTQLIAFVKGLM
jgi:hypothetical protein